MSHRRNRSRKNKKRDPEKYQLKIKTTPKAIKFFKDAEKPNFINFGRKKREIIYMALLLLGAGVMFYLQHHIVYLIVIILSSILLVMFCIELKKMKDERRKELRRLQKIEDHKFIL